MVDNIARGLAFSLAGVQWSIQTPIDNTYNLVFCDEFNGSTLDLTKWSPNWFGASAAAVTPPVNSNVALAAFDPAQIKIKNSLLYLTTVASDWPNPSQISTVTTNSPSSPVTVTWSGLAIGNGEIVWLSSTGTLPAPLAPSTNYYLVNTSGSTFQLAATPGGTAINTTNAGSGTITAQQHFAYRTGHINTNPQFNVASPGFQIAPSSSYSVYIEARIWIQTGSNGQVVNWPSFWTNGQNNPTTGEIDIAECAGGFVQAAYHSGSGNFGSGAFVQTYGGWHHFAVLWSTSKVQYFYDGSLVFTQSTGVASANNYLILQNSMDGGVFGGVNMIPATMITDYVHVYTNNPAVAVVTPQSGYNGPGNMGHI